MTIGSKRQVWNETADTTVGGLKKSDLMKNKSGKIVSKARSENAKKSNNLGKYLK